MARADPSQQTKLRSNNFTLAFDELKTYCKMFAFQYPTLIIFFFQISTKKLFSSKFSSNKIK